MKGINAPWLYLKNLRQNYLRQQWAAYCHARNLRCLKDETSRIGKNDILCVVILRNEKVRIPFFLQYYRNLGVDHFLFIDNGSTDGLRELLASEKDCSHWFTEESYRQSNFGVYWANYLLRRYGTGHWCLMLDPDEFLVYPYMETRSLRDLTDFLAQEGKDSFFTIMLDMYNDGPMEEAVYQEGQDPLEVCPWFDGAGYYQEFQPHYRNYWIRGGVRRRVFNADNPGLAPAVNKTVLVKWHSHFSFISSAHVVWPRRLNRPHFRNMLAPTGCLLHFKYLALFKEKVSEELQRKQHFADSREYVRYSEILKTDKVRLWHEASVGFTDWQQCVDLGFMNVGCWF